MLVALETFSIIIRKTEKTNCWYGIIIMNAGEAWSRGWGQRSALIRVWQFNLWFSSVYWVLGCLCGAVV